VQPVDRPPTALIVAGFAACLVAAAHAQLPAGYPIEWPEVAEPGLMRPGFRFPVTSRSRRHRSGCPIAAGGEGISPSARDLQFTTSSMSFRIVTAQVQWLHTTNRSFRRCASFAKSFIAKRKFAPAPKAICQKKLANCLERRIWESRVETTTWKRLALDAYRQIPQNLPKRQIS
jgi:hypothetical protein